MALTPEQIEALQKLGLPAAEAPAPTLSGNWAAAGMPARGALTVTPVGPANNDPFGLMGGGGAAPPPVLNVPAPYERPYSANPAVARPGTPYAQNPNLTSQNNMSVNPVGNPYRRAGGPSTESGGTPMSPWGAGAGGGTARIPERNDPTTAPKYIEQMESAYAEQRKAYDKERFAAGGQAEAEAGVSEARARGAGLQALEGLSSKMKVEQKQGEREKVSREWMDKLDAYSEKLANEKIEKPGFLDSARWTIASMLGAVQQGMLGLKTNQIADAVQDRIALDLHRQQLEFERHKGRKEDLKSLYALAYQQTGDSLEAQKLANSYALDMAKHEADALVANADSSVAAARGEVVKAAIDTKKAQLSGQEAESEMKTHKFTPAQTVSTGPNEKELTKRAQKIADESATPMTPYEARRLAYIEMTGRDPAPKMGPIPSYGTKKGDKEGVIPAGAPDAAAMSVISRLPQHLQAEAVKEYSAAGAAAQSKAAVERSFKNYEEQSAMPGTAGRDVERAALRAAIKPHIKGANSDKDLDVLIEPYIPAPLDSDERKAQKKAAIEQLIDANAATPLLNSVGVKPNIAPSPGSAALPKSAQEVK